MRAQTPQHHHQRPVRRPGEGCGEAPAGSRHAWPDRGWNGGRTLPPVRASRTRLSHKFARMDEAHFVLDATSLRALHIFGHAAPPRYNCLLALRCSLPSGTRCVGPHITFVSKWPPSVLTMTVACPICPESAACTSVPDQKIRQLRRCCAASLRSPESLLMQPM
jgi:hypothetical protein